MTSNKKLNKKLIGDLTTNLQKYQEELAKVQKQLYMATVTGTPKSTSPAPKGWVLVPTEPTSQMIKAARLVDAGSGWLASSYAPRYYKAMLQAAPNEKPYATNDFIKIFRELLIFMEHYNNRWDGVNRWDGENVHPHEIVESARTLLQAISER